MKILQITPQEPAYNSGGGIGVLQTTNSLIFNDYEVDYIGPRIIDSSINKLYKNTFFLERTTNPIERIVYLFQGISSSLYNAWKHFELDINKYDAIVMDFTKLDFVLPKLKDKPLIVKVHNVEFDYSNGDYKRNKSFSKMVVAKLSFKQETRILERADVILALTVNDKKRLVELYGKGLETKIVLNPVSLNAKGNKKYLRGSALKMLITGSLWYGENANGVMWFLDNVFSKLPFNAQLIIAGAHPSEALKSKIAAIDNVKLIDTPATMEPYFEECDLCIAPIFMGAGMKVKVCEAFSYGKPVLGTDYAFIGYEIVDRYNSFIANTSQEFIEQLCYINSLEKDNWKKIINNINQLFDNMYSIESSAMQWKKAIVGGLRGYDDYN